MDVSINFIEFNLDLLDNNYILNQDNIKEFIIYIYGKGY